MHIRRTLLAALSAAALSACGDNPAEQVPALPAQADNEVPASAFASTTAYSAFAGMLAPTDSSEPLKLGPAAAPTSENEEPLPVAR